MNLWGHEQKVIAIKYELSNLKRGRRYEQLFRLKQMHENIIKVIRKNKDKKK